MMPTYDSGSNESRRQRFQRLSAQATPVDPASPAAVTVPIDASSTELAAQARMFLLQLIPAVGILLSVFGFSDTSRVMQIWRFLNTEPAIPIITAAASAIAIVWGQIRARRRQRSIQTLALLPTTPDSVAIGPQNPSAAVVSAVEAATVLIDRQGAGQAPIEP